MPEVSPPKTCLNLSSPPYVLHTLSMPLFLISKRYVHYSHIPGNSHCYGGSFHRSYVLRMCWEFWTRFDPFETSWVGGKCASWFFPGLPLLLDADFLHFFYLFRDAVRQYDVDSRLVGEWLVAKGDCGLFGALCTNFPEANEETT